MKYIIAYDLGTGGTKTSLFDENGVSRASAFTDCQTFYPHSGWHEQRPQDWWDSVVTSTRKMLGCSGVDVKDIAALAVSGHSLGVTPVAGDGRLLAEYVPIWSDTRADRQAGRFFQTVDEEDWYMTTGSGFPAALYSIFKIMWYMDEYPQLYKDTAKFIGTKDYINFRMTGVLCTDRSYASGSGVYSLKDEGYLDSYIEASGVKREKLPDVYPSTHVIGTILPEAARILGLSEHTKVCAGGVDNACMALGAACISDGEAYTSLGSSSWIAVSDSNPVVNAGKRPYVFAHCVPGQYVSATSIFSAGSSLKWVRGTICPDLLKAEEEGGRDSYDVMNELAAASPIGANGLIFNPSLAGGSGLDKSANVRGCFTGLDLMHTRGDLIRATMEGVCMNLKLALQVLEDNTRISDEMLIVGGGGKSQLWRQMFADIYQKNILETNVGQDAGSLGAAAVAAVGAGLWKDFSRVREVHRLKRRIGPEPEAVLAYGRILPVFGKVADIQSDIGDMLAELKM
uniref:xylulokinase n=1 Tax=Enterocloster aldenensis TaxID=358742 RepID=UPI0036F25BBC